MKTPCLRICRIEEDHCSICKRTMSEIASWRRYTDEEREIIMKDLEKR